MSREILSLIASETRGKSYQAHKIELDNEIDTASRIDNRESNLENPSFGETIKYKGYRSIEKLAQRISNNNSQILTYFLDGSRHIYKVDDIAYEHGNSRKIVYPIVAGQIGVGCCNRIDKKMAAEQFRNEIVLTLPDIANYNDNRGFFPALVTKINAKLTGKNFNVTISKIIGYSTDQANSKAQEFEERAVIQIQNYMYQAEQDMVANLVAQNKLNQRNYLIKDGSLEYRIPPDVMRDKRKFSRFKNNFGYVIGVSKKFNPALWTEFNHKPNPGYIAELPLYHRTPTLCFENADFHGDIKFAVWYLRIRDNEHVDSPFDGVIKVEKMLVNHDETDSGKIDSELVDYLSANLINERNPVCYGSDNRWANHIYPIFVTESFVKSKCIAAETFLHLF